MAKIYVGQTSLRLKFVTSVDITDAVCQIKYKKPDGTPGIWSGIVSDPDKGIFYYDVKSNDLDQAGDWVLWAHITFKDFTSAPGESVIMSVYEEGK